MKNHVIKKIMSSLPPMSKNNLITSRKNKLPTLSKGRPSILKTTKETVTSFLERPDISYCKPCQTDTVYCGKDTATVKIFSKHIIILCGYIK